jgi:uncharacterized protein YciI
MLEHRAPHRALHLEGLQSLAASGTLRFAGAWTEPLYGAIWVIDAKSHKEVEGIIRDDAYFIAGLMPSWTTREVSPARLHEENGGHEVPSVS